MTPLTQLNCQVKRKKSSLNSSQLLLGSLLVGLALGGAPPETRSVSQELSGIGYLDIDGRTGINKGSFAGGLEMVVRGTGFGLSPTQNLLAFTAQDFDDVQVLGEGMSEDNAIKSCAPQGVIQYTTRSVGQMFDMPNSMFYNMDTMTFNVSVYAPDVIGMTDFVEMSCDQNPDYCNIVYSRSYTPMLKFAVPPILHLDSEVAFIVDPRNAQDMKGDNENPFVHVKVDGNFIDFDERVDVTTWLNTWDENSVIGKIGETNLNETSDVNFLFHTGFAMHQEQTMTTCSYDNQTCYKFKTVPMISEIDFETGYSTGGQNLTIHGYGFQSGEVEVEIDGVPCEVTRQDRYSVSCNTESANMTDLEINEYVGQHGARMKWINNSDTEEWDNIWNHATNENVIEHLALTLESLPNYETYSYYLYTGYFKAPATTNYRFYGSGENWMRFSFSNVSDDKESKITSIISDGMYAPDLRQFYRNDSYEHISEWYALEEGGNYFFETVLYQYSGDSHMSVGVEIEQDEIVGHHHAIKEVQMISIEPEQLYDTTQINFTEPDGGTVIFAFYGPNTGEYTYSSAVSTTASAGTMKQAIKWFYFNEWGSQFNVVRTIYDIDGNVTTSDSEEAYIYSYNITLTKMISGESTNTILAVPQTTTSTIDIALPSEMVVSNLPVSGCFKIKCVNADGIESYTEEMSYGKQVKWIEKAIDEGCPEFREQVRVRDYKSYSYSQSGRSLLLDFKGYNGNPGQFEIVSGEDCTLAEHAFTLAETIQEYGTNIFYDAIPFEMIHTDEVLPQVKVSVNGLPAVCKNLTCDYTFIESPYEITSFSVDETEQTLTMEGISLPEDIYSISFTNVDCDDYVVEQIEETYYTDETDEYGNVTTTETTEITGATITCTMVDSLTGGYFRPIVKDAYGIIPISDDVEDFYKEITVDSVVGADNLNMMGGDYLYLGGTGFPSRSNDGSEIYVYLGDGTECDIEEIDSTEIVCKVRRLSSDSIGASLNVTLYLNGIEDGSHTVQVASYFNSIGGIEPESYSPVLKRNLTITMDENFAEELVTDDLWVTLIQQEDPEIQKACNVIDVDNELKTITVRYGGAYSGVYDLSVQSDTYGEILTDGITFEAVGTITDFYPTSGSIYGGTLITISGYHFSDEAADNPLTIGGMSCNVEESSEFEIQCRMQDLAVESGTEGQILIFMKMSEEATCTTETEECYFTFTDQGLPVLSDVQVSFDDELQNYIITISGTGFDEESTSTELYIDGYSQTLQSLTTDTIVFELSGLTSWYSTDIQLYVTEGVPEGYELLLNGLEFEPKLAGLTTNSGSVAGSRIYASVAGIGLDATDVTLVDGDGTEICQAIAVYEYGELECDTIEGEIVEGTLIYLSVSSVAYNCSSLDEGDCYYEQVIDAMAEVTSLSVFAMFSIEDTTTLMIEGSNFPFEGYTGIVSYNNIEADQVTIESDTLMYATFMMGIPVSDDEIYPNVQFEEDETSVIHTAYNVNATFSNPLVISDSSQFECSFAGGCLLKVYADGLSSSLTDEENSYITVCENICVFDADQSSQSKAVCEIPMLKTTYSMTAYNMVEVGSVYGVDYFGSEGSEPEYAFNLENLDRNEDWNADCYFGTSFPEGYVGLLDEVKIYLGSLSKYYYADNLIFQGSNDGETYTDIFTLSKEIHEGWNYYDFEEDEMPSFRFYRFYGSESGACTVNEVHLFGVEVIQDDVSSHECLPVLHHDGTTIDLPNSLTYQATLTPLLNSIYPRFGSVRGGDEVTFYGENFSEDYTKYTILIDDIECEVTAATVSSVTCVTGDKPGLSTDPYLQIYIEDQGLVANNGKTFRYVYLWSDTRTWGGEFLPMEGDSISIPYGLNLLVDVDSTPLLNAIIVEGSLIFPPDDLNPAHQRTFDAFYIITNFGYIEIGTEEEPYTSQLTITMHGTIQSNSIPTFGNKVLAISGGQLEMHGVERFPTWTQLETTAEVGATTITLQEAVDWQVGEQIVIAPTDFESRHAEQRNIVAIDNTDPDHPVLTLDVELYFKHFADTEYYDDLFIDMRAEVGLLTRNVKFQGDKEYSEENQYGGQIMIHSDGDETSQARIAHCELFNVGQGFKLGRYAIHFHMIGTVHKSYVKGNAVWQSYNRGTTIHGVHHLTIANNVMYDTMGHTIFIEDAAETNNIVEYNLIVMTKKSWSGLNTDQTPGSMWITNPNNIIRYNHAAGSDRYGFWYDMQDTAIGPSFSTDICPFGTKLGQFEGNVAHSNGRYGLRVFHGMMPREYPCESIVYDAENPDDPYHNNRPIPGYFIDFTGYKNKRNGAISERTGDLRWIDFKVADNLLAGVEVSVVEDAGDDMAQLNGALIVGRSRGNQEDILNWNSPKGFHGPRSENYTVNNVSFYSFDFANAAAISTCSHCWHDDATDSGARTVRFSSLYFEDDTVPRRISYTVPWRGILFDMDGTLTELGPNTWATAYWRHLDQPECDNTQQEKFGGLICDDTVQIRRVAHHGYSPSSIQGMLFKIIQWDDDIIGEMTEDELQVYLDDYDNYSEIPFKQFQDPAMGWAIPFVTNHKYKWHFASALDFEQIKFDLSERWEATDHPIYMVSNFTDQRASVDIKVESDSDYIANETLTSIDQADWQLGHNIIYNDTETREIHYIISGADTDRRSVQINIQRCIGPCNSAVEEQETEDTIRLWSNPDSWPTGELPVADQYVEIESGWNMVFDLENSPIIDTVQINGRLSFLDGAETSLNLHVKHIFVRAGELIIGTVEEPFQGDAQITLYGEQSSETIVFDNTIEAGNKVISNVGNIEMHGIQRPQRMFRLMEAAESGATEILLQTGLDLVEGDKLGLLPTGFNYLESDEVEVLSYDSETGVVAMNRELNYYHFGQNTSTVEAYGIDMRAEVLLLNSNVRIVGEDVSAWGGTIITADTIDSDLSIRTGVTIMDNVEIYNCSQRDTYKAALRWENAQMGYSSITNCSIHGGLGWGLRAHSSQNLVIDNNVAFGFSTVGMSLSTVSNVTFSNNVVGNIMRRQQTAVGSYEDTRCGVCICSHMDSAACSDIHVFNNIIGGAEFVGITGYTHECGEVTDVMFNNTAHSIEGKGVDVQTDPTSSTQTTCAEMSYSNSYKCTEQGAIFYKETKEIRVTNMVAVDNILGIAALLATGNSWTEVSLGSEVTISIEDNIIIGSTHVPNGDYECQDRTGMFISGATLTGKELHPTSSSALPIYKINDIQVFQQKTIYKNNQFIGYSDPIVPGCPENKNRIFMLNSGMADYVPIQYFYDTHFEDIDDDAFAWWFDAPDSWAEIDDCGEVVCTGNKNVLAEFRDTTWSGRTPTFAASKFQVIPDNTGVSPYVSGCDYYKTHNGYICDNDKLGILHFKALDDDSYDRSVQPVYVSNNDTGINNKLNSFMDHVWDGFYTGQVRESTFPSLVVTDYDYDVEYTGTPFKKMIYALRANQGGVKIRVQYFNAETYIVTDLDGNKYEPNEFDEDEGVQGAIKKNGCGENRFLGQQKILEFYIEADCQVKIQDVQAIQTAVRLDIDIDTFFSGGGVTSFTDNIAGALGIHASNIKIVSVYEGSVVVDYYIIADDDDDDAEATLAAIETTLVTALDEGTIDLGAPVLEVSVTSSSGTTYEPIAIVEEVEEEEDEEADEEAEEVTIDIQLGDETTEVEEQSTIETIQEIAKSNDKFYVIIVCLIPLTLLTTIAIIMLRKRMTQKQQNKREIDQVREVAQKHAEENEVVEVVDQYVPDMNFDIFGINEPSKNKKDLKNQDKDMVIENDLVVNDELDFGDDDDSNHNEQSQSNRSDQKTSSGQLNNEQTAQQTSSHQYDQLGRDSSIAGSFNNTMSAMKNSNDDNSLMSLNRPSSGISSILRSEKE